MPSHPSVLTLLQDGIRLHRAGRMADAAARYAAVLRVDQRNFDALHLGGLVALQQGQAEQAARLLAAAHRVNPADRICAMRVALAERALGRLDAAEKRLRDLVATPPPFAEAWDNLGHVLKARGALGEARDCHQRAVEIDPAAGQAWYNLGLTECLLGDPTAGLAAQDRALTAATPYPRARYGRAVALQQLHRLPEALADYAAHLAAEPSHLAAHSGHLLCRQYLDAPEPAAHAAALGAWRDALPRPARLETRPAHDRRLRVGFVSADFRRHSVAWFMLPLLRGLDRRRFVVVLYHDHGVTDEVSAEFKALADVWRETVTLSPADFINAVRKDALDLAIDLGGHTGGNRLPAFAARLAPVQATYLGFPDTTGVPAMDFRLVDEVTDPTDDDVSVTEQRIRFAPTAWTYQPPPEAPETRPGPGAAAADSPVVFGSYNNFAKVSPGTLALWARVLDAVPGSRLALKSPGLDRATALAATTPHGIDPDRVEVLPLARDTAGHLAQYARMDIALDPLPYHGTTTTCEALWMGRPVVTLAGERHANRVGASLLGAVDRAEWVAYDDSEYVAIAAALAADRAALRAQQVGALRAAMQNSPLLDHAAQAARFGAALERCWHLRTAEGDEVARAA